VPSCNVARMSDSDSIVFTARWARGVRAATWVMCGVVIVGAALADWDALYGRPTVMSGVRPALKSGISAILDPGTPPVRPQQQQQQQQQKQQER